MLPLLIGATASAGSIAGLSVPGAGGGFAHPAEPGALGLFTAPTAAALAPSPQIAVDVGLLGTSLRTDLEGWDAPLTSRSVTPVPSLSVAVPLGPVALGALFQAPYGRGGGSGSAEPGPERFYSAGSSVRLLEQQVTAAVRPVDALVLGAGVRVGEYAYWSTYAVDTGVSLNTSLSPDPPLPIGEPLLEGTQTVEGVRDLVLSWVAGAALVHPAGHQLVVAFRPPWRTAGEGAVVSVPSNDLAARIEGRIGVELVLPAHLHVAGRVELGRVTLLPEVEWVGWGRTGRYTATPADLRLVAEDPVLDGVLAGSGLDRAAFLTSQEQQQAYDLHWNDVVNLGLAADVGVTERLDLRAGVWRSPGAAQLDWIHPANLDFTVWDLRAGARFDVVPALTVAATADLYAAPARRVTESVYTQVDPETPAQALPTANGRYAARLWRIGATLVFHLPALGG